MMPVIGVVIVLNLIAHSGLAIRSPGIAFIEERFARRILIRAIRFTGSASANPTGRIVVVIHIVLVSRMLNVLLVKYVVAVSRVRNARGGIEV
jgi:hypothetical protein